MCYRTSCRTCGKPTYAGCGMHIEMVLADVPRELRCRCREEREAARRAAREARRAAGGGRSWWERLLRK